MLKTNMFTLVSNSFMLKTHKSWEITIMLSLLMTIMMSMYYPMMDFMYLVSYMFKLDSMSMLMVALSMWITSMMMLSSYLLKNKKNKSLFIYYYLITIVINPYTMLYFK